jgi:hypothetical protein
VHQSLGALNQLAVDAQVQEIITLKQQLAAMLQSPQEDNQAKHTQVPGQQIQHYREYRERKRGGIAHSGAGE